MSGFLAYEVNGGVSTYNLEKGIRMVRVWEGLGDLEGDVLIGSGGT